MGDARELQSKLDSIDSRVLNATRVCRRQLIGILGFLNTAHQPNIKSYINNFRESNCPLRTPRLAPPLLGIHPDPLPLLLRQRYHYLISEAD